MHAGNRSQRLSAIIPVSLVAFPPVLFYTILFRKSLNLPFQDDYEGLLDFLNQMVTLQSFSERASYFLASQYNEYKLFFVHGLTWVWLSLFKHLDMRYLSAAGNGFVLLLGILLWKMFLPKNDDFVLRATFFIPVSWLLFQLQYVETLDWAMPSLANLPVLAFSLGAIYFLMQATPRSFLIALTCLVLAVASIGSGLLMIPIGLLMLAVDRHYKRLVIWLLVSAGCVGAYAYRYNTLSSQSRLNHSVLTTVIRPRPQYVLAFMGSAATSPTREHDSLEIGFSLFLGVTLCAFFFILARRGYFRRNPLLGYCVLFLLLTAIGVAGLRSDIGIWQSLDSRYTIYSALLIIFAWFAIVEEFLQHKGVSAWRSKTLLVATGGAIVFSLGMDLSGAHYLDGRNYEMILGMAAYEHPSSPDHIDGPMIARHQNARFDELARRAPIILKRSTELSIYQPPPLQAHGLALDQ